MLSTKDIFLRWSWTQRASIVRRRKCNDQSPTKRYSRSWFFANLASFDTRRQPVAGKCSTNILGTFIATRNTARAPVYVTLLTSTGLNPEDTSAMMNFYKKAIAWLLPESNSQVDSLTLFRSMILLCQRSPHIIDTQLPSCSDYECRLIGGPGGRWWVVKPPASFPGLSLSKGKTLGTRLVSHAGHAQAMDNFQVLFRPKKSCKTGKT